MSNTSGTIRAFVQRGTGGNDLWVWTSTNNGASWAGPVSVLSPPGGALCKGMGSAGNNDIFFLYDVAGGEAMGNSFINGGIWSSLNTWTLPTIPAGAGCAPAWNMPAGLYTIVYSDSYSLASATYNPSSGAWAASSVVAPSTSTAIGRSGPRVTLADGVYTCACIEFDSGILTSAVYCYPRMRQSADMMHWSNGTIAHEMNVATAYSVTAFKLSAPQTGTSGARYYIAMMGKVLSAKVYAQSDATQYLDVSASILWYSRLEGPGMPSKLEVVLENNRGVLNALVTSGTNYQPVGANASLVLSEGYKVGSPPVTNDVVAVGKYRINQIHFERSPEKNQVRLVGLDVSRNLDLEARYQTTYTNQALSWMVTEVCARAGLLSVSVPNTSQMTNLIPAFIIPAGQSYRRALDELCATYGLAYFMDQTETIVFRELAALDASVWTYQPEVETVSFVTDDARANHIIVSGKPPVTNPSALTTGEVYDDANAAAVGLERVLHHVDPKLTTAPQCSQKAQFLLAQEQRNERAHRVTVPNNPALQLIDVVTLTDSAAPTGSGQSGTARIIQVHTTFEAAQAICSSQLALEGV